MSEPLRTIAAPLRSCRPLKYSDVAVAVAADSLVRRAWSSGRQAELILPAVTGDAFGQYAFERELGREGHDRLSLTTDEYQLRRAAFDEQRRVAVCDTLAGLGITAPLIEVSDASTAVVRATRTAFVTLYEQGMIEQSQRVVLNCSHCQTPLDDLDVEVVETDGERLLLTLSATNGSELVVKTDAPELLAGVAAVAVAGGHPATGADVILPLAGIPVPVLEDTSGAIVPGEDAGGRFLVTAHDSVAHGVAQEAGLPVVPVLDGGGFIATPGPLEGLPRYAARSAARQLLVAEGVLTAAEPVTHELSRCGCCGTVLVPQLGRHWFLRSGEMEVAAADAVRDGMVQFTPAEAREAFLAVAGIRRDWCLSSYVPGGIAVPAATCLDCGRLAVASEPLSSCGSCMGPLAPEEGGLDPRFVAAAWALGLDGWPGRRASASAEAETVAVVAGEDLGGWVLPALALGLRLAGSAPFTHVTVHPWPSAPQAPVEQFLDPNHDPRVRRLALVAGTGDLSAARAAVAELDDPHGPGGEHEASVTAAAAMAALADGAPAQAGGLLTAALTTGVPLDTAHRLRALAAPVLGD